jgi:hypothetical protein
MLQPTSLRDVFRNPVTASVAAAAVVVTGLWWPGHYIDGLVMNGQVWENWRLWRGLTCTLPHVNVGFGGFVIVGPGESSRLCL